MWIYHDICHAFVVETWPPQYPIISACGLHTMHGGDRHAMGAAKCIECAEALGDTGHEREPLRWAHNTDRAVHKMGCLYCETPAPRPDTVGQTDAGIYAPNSAINAMKKKQREGSQR